ncbi:hypothetical protein [Rothia nasimurium]|uniref:hypothetical protein n=1 Tax=Rothia nasimurium TaxID=85336 RepID=UPI001F276826|nr:hypothetical protein [Rothia nasimurium]
MTDPEQNPRPSRYGRRLEDLSDDERAYYREFLPPQAFTGEQVAGQASAPLESADAAHPARTVPDAQQGKRSRSRWYWLPHSLTIVAVILAVASFLVVPAIYSDATPELRRNYVIMWAELAFFFLLFAALLYGIFALSRFTDHDDEDDDRLMRPTDFAERLYEQELERGTGRNGGNGPGVGGLYDSSWISGKKND